LASEPIRVLRVIARLNMGGPALHVAYLSAGLRSRGYETTLVAGDLAEGEESMAYVAERLGVTVTALPGLHREIAPLRDLAATIRVARMLRRERPHILHTHTAKAGAIGRIAALLMPRRRRPIVVHTFHGHVLRGYFGWLRSGLFRRMERLLAYAADALVAVSPEVRDDLVALGVAPTDKFAVIRLGIELDERVRGNGASRAATRRTLGIADAHFLVGWIGRMTAVKRTDDVLRAFKLLCDRGVDAYLCMVGDGPDFGHVLDLAGQLGIMRRCLFPGYQEDIGPFFGAFDVFVLPSGNEGTPVTAIEALAGGCPIVATRVGGVPDVVRDGQDGFLVELGDVEALAEHLASLAADPELRRRLGEAGRERVAQRYAVSRLVDEVDALYRSLLARRENLPLNAPGAGTR
jgi:glycosyltransferase involved in cell wall biosynthesis